MSDSLKQKVVDALQTIKNNHDARGHPQHAKEVADFALEFFGVELQ